MHKLSLMRQLAIQKIGGIHMNSPLLYRLICHAASSEKGGSQTWQTITMTTENPTIISP